MEDNHVHYEDSFGSAAVECANASFVVVEAPVGAEDRWRLAALAFATAVSQLSLLNRAGTGDFFPHFCASVFIGGFLWLFLFFVNKIYGSRVRIRFVRSFLAKYAMAASLAGCFSGLSGMYLSDRLFHVWNPSEAHTALHLAFAVALVTALSSSAGLVLALHTEAIEVARVRQLAAEAELRALKAQIHPHFLFNTLNGILHLINSAPKKAEAMLLNLSGALRFVLRSVDRETVSLAEEIDFVRSYLEIETTRFSENLKIRIDVPVEALAQQIPPCVLQILVENAIRHGIAPNEGGGKVEIGARVCKTGFKITVEDDGVGIQRGTRTDFYGIGLRNVQERLLSCLGPHSRLEFESRPGIGTRVSFLLPS
jgi:sensor histidine kinase YesM